VGQNLDSVATRIVYLQCDLTCATQVINGKKYLIPGEIRTKIHDLLYEAFAAMQMQRPMDLLDRSLGIHAYLLVPG
jgi:hypothetical protein